MCSRCFSRVTVTLNDLLVGSFSCDSLISTSCKESDEKCEMKYLWCVSSASRPASLCLAPKAAISSSSSSLRKSSSSTLPSSPSSRNYSPAPGAKRTPAGSSKDTPSTKVKTSISSCRKALEIKPKETAAGKTGSRRVTHCKDLSDAAVRKDWVS
ncbi:uncharacterized protein LOC131526960 isoform X1 [Onychostoma macrolepis]|uniref:uncharacterized protein LOC131526960 isoform X1 n=1 Tax=Onychostoma macrolepis TaxID=369639 RepID=UPI00272A0D1E|nr:uncharacterized protein LOC131526960 isoform X1 [Onychostoma macrolepis]